MIFSNIGSCGAQILIMSNMLHLLYSCLIVLNTLGSQAFETSIPNNDTKVHQDIHCEICVLEKCLHMTESKCEYYNKVDGLWNNLESENDVLEVADQTEINKINTVVYDFVNEGMAVFEEGKCVPLISQYTDCHRDNICTGCYFCKCDSSGSWDCSVRQRCEQGPRASTVSTHRLLSFMTDMFYKPGDTVSLDNRTEQSNVTTNDVHLNESHTLQTIRQKRENQKLYFRNKYSSINDLKLNALYPLTSIIHKKIAEIIDLAKIRNYLSDYLQSLGVTDVTNEINDIENLKEHSKNPEFVIYKFETNKDATLISRRPKPNDLHNIKDHIKQLLTGIHYAKNKIELKNKSKLSNDLKTIMFIQNHAYKNKSENLRINKNFTLTDSTHKVLKRIAENLDLITQSDNEENNAYNIVETLSQVGRTWRKLYYNIKNSHFYNRLDNIKLLHLTLFIDINKVDKILNTLTVENFSKNNSAEKNKCDVLIHKLDLGIALMQKSIMKISLGNKDLSNDEIKHHHNITTNLKTDKDTLVHRIGKVLKSTKNDVVAILKSKFIHNLPKALTSKELTKLNEKKFKNYESVMLDWQNKLNVGLRRRRSVLGYQSKTRKIRLTHILPKYLRGKMNPIIISNKKNNKNDTKKQLLQKH